MKVRPLLVMLMLAVFVSAAVAPMALGAAKAPKVTLKGPAKVKAGAKFQLKGVLVPMSSAQAKSTNRAKIYRLSGGAWKKVASVGIVPDLYGGGTSTFKAKLKAGSKVGTKMRFKATWTAAKKTGASKVLVVTVK